MPILVMAVIVRIALVFAMPVLQMFRAAIGPALALVVMMVLVLTSGQQEQAGKPKKINKDFHNQIPNSNSYGQRHPANGVKPELAGGADTLPASSSDCRRRRVESPQREESPKSSCLL